ncbi:MAG: hypothetical protein RRC34_10160 [Lentisphaeria bacterium]|nr:hypothetical protein [Lentisphaeria bacterium]
MKKCSSVCLRAGLYAKTRKLQFVYAYWENKSHPSGASPAAHIRAFSFKAVMVAGEARKGKPSYLSRLVLVRDGQDVCTIQPPRLFSRELVFTFPNRDRCSFRYHLFGNTYRGSSEAGWGYEAIQSGDDWNLSIWGLEDDLILLSALIYCYRNVYWNRYS